MKRITALLLCFAMLLSMSACGAESYIGNNISVSIKNNGKKKLTLNCKDMFDEVYTLSYSFSGIGEGSDESLFDVVNTKSEAGENTYRFTGNMSGEGGMSITYKNTDGVAIGCVSADVSVDEGGRVTISNVSVTNGTGYTKIYASEEDESGDEENISISEGSGGTKLVKLANTGGSWELDDYNYEVTEAEGPEILDLGKYYQFRFSAIAEGESIAYIINRSEKIQFVLTFVSESDPDAPGSFILTLKDAFKTEYRPETQPEEKEKYEEAKEEIPEIIIIPDDPIDPVEPDDPVKPDDPDDPVEPDDSDDSEKKEESEKKEDTSEDKKGEKIVIEEVVINYEDADMSNKGTSCEMTFEYNGIKVDYAATTTVNYYDVTHGIIDAADPVEELIVSGGGIEAQYYYMPTGFGAAVWKSGNVVHRLTFMNKDKTSADFKNLLQKLLNAQTF